MNKKILWSVIIIIVIVAIIGLSKTQTKSAAIRIGATESLTGSAAYYGQSSQKGIDLGFEWVKKQYPDLNIEIFHEDNQFNPKVSVDAYNKLYNIDKIDAVLTQNSPEAIAIEPLAKKDGILQMALSASAQNYSSPNDLSFRMTGGSDLETKPMIDYIAKNYKSIAIFYMNNEIGLSQSVSLGKGFEEGHVKVVTNEAFPVDANDFRSSLTKIKVFKPEVVYVAGLTAHISNFLKQMKELGIGAKVMTFRTGDDVNLIKQSGDLAEGIIFTSNFDPNGTSTDILGFVTDFKNKYGDLPDSYAAEGYEGMRFVGRAFAKCGKDYSCIKDFLINTKDYPTIFGNISFDTNGDISYSYFLKTIKDGKFVRLGE